MTSNQRDVIQVWSYDFPPLKRDVFRRPSVVDCGPLFSIDAIVHAVSDVMKIPVSAIMSPRRFRDVATARQICFYLASQFTTNSYPVIGRIMKRDHTTIIHAYKKISGDPETYKPLLDQVIARLAETRDADRLSA